ncbi:MAG: PAS domain S-box protein [Chloroflexi bacterium]|nr:PAS domain S-box protein [Chloroflexota bacterium]
MDRRNLSPGEGFPLRIALIYMVVGSAWIVVSDWAVNLIFTSDEWILRVQTYKGALYVAFTSFVLYLLLKNYIRREQRAHHALLHSERTNRALLDAIPDLIFRTDRDGKFLSYQAPAGSLAGQLSQPVLGQHLTSFMPPDQAQTNLEYIRRALDTRRTEILEYQFHGREYEARYVASGSDEVMIIVRDITTRKTTEAAQRELQVQLEHLIRARTTELTADRNLLRTLLDHIPDYVYIKDRDSRFLTANAAVVQLMGQTSADEVVGKTDHDFFPPELANRFLQDERAIFESGEPLINQEEPGQDPAGNARWILTTKVPIRDAEGTITRLVGIGRDITARKQIESELRRAHAELEQRVLDRTARLVEANEALQRSQRQLQLVLEGSTDGFWDWHIPSGNVVFSPRWAEMLGYRLDEIEPHVSSWEQLVHPDDMPWVNEVLQAHLRGETEQYSAEHRMRTKAGEWKWILDRGKVVERDQHGNPIRAAGTHVDISQRRIAEEARRESENRYRTLFESANDALILIKDGKFVDCNPRTLDLYGHTREDLIGRSPIDFSPERQPDGQLSREAATARIQAAMRGEPQRFEWQHVRKDGSLVIVEVSLREITILGEKLLLAAVRDITARKHAERALRESEERFRTAFDSAAAGIALVAPDQRFSRVNQALCNMLGYTAFELTGKTFREITHPDDLPATDANWQKVFDDQHVTIQYEKRYLHRGGHPVWVDVTSAVLYNDEGQPQHIIAQVQDITQRKQAEDALFRALRAYRALSDCNQTMIRATDENTLLHDVCRIIVDTGDYRMAWVGLVDEAEQTIQPMAWAGHEDGYLSQVMLMVRDTNPTSAAVRQNEPRLVTDIANHTSPAQSESATWDTLALQRGYRSLLALPLEIDDEAAGVLVVFSAQPATFTTDEIALLNELAGDLAYGIAVLRTQQARTQAQTELAASRSYLAALFENTSDAIWSVDTDYRLVTGNSAFRQRFQRTTNAIPNPGEKFTDQFTPDAQVRWQALLDRALGGEQFTHDLWYDVDDQRIYIEQSFNPIVTDDGDIIGVSIFARDTTARTQAEETLLQLNHQLEQRNRHLLTVLEIGRKLRSTLDSVTIYRMLHEEIAQRLLNAPYFFIAILDASTQSFVLDFAVVGGTEVDATRFATVPLTRLPYTAGLASHRPWIADAEALQAHLALRAETLDVFGEHPPQSAFFLPLTSGEEVTGLLGLFDSQPDAFQHADLTMFGILANQAAISLHNAQLFAAEREQHAMAQAISDNVATISQTLDPDVVLDRMLDNLKRVVPHDAADIMMIENNQARVVRATGYHREDLASWLSALRLDADQYPILKHIITTGQAYISHDTAADPNYHSFDETAWLRSMASAPITLDGQVIGVLNVHSTTSGFFTAQHAVRLQTFANQTSVAIRNARMYAATQQHAAELQAQAQRLAQVNRISNRLAQSLDLEEIYRISLLELQALMGVQYGGLALFEDEHTSRLVFDTHPIDTRRRNVMIPLADNPSIELIRRTHKPLVSYDVQTDPLFEAVWDLMRRRGTRSLIVAPLVVGDEVMGTLGLDSTEYRHFEPFEIELVEIIANQASISIAKAQLYDAEREQRILSEALSDTAAAVNSTLDVDEVLARILDNIGRVIPHDAANIMHIKDGVAQVAQHYGYDVNGPADWLDTLRTRIDSVPVWHSMIRLGQAIVVPDTAEEPDWIARPETRWVRASLKAPIYLEGEPAGILHLDSATPGTFSRKQATHLQAFADQAAIAIYNAQLFTDEREQRTLAEALRNTATTLTSTLDPGHVLSRVLDNVGQVVPHDAANIMLLDSEQNMARVVGSHGYERYHLADWIKQLVVPTDDPGYFIHNVIQSGDWYIVADTRTNTGWQDLPNLDWIRSFAGAPIRLYGELVGLLNLDSATPNFFTPEHGERLQALADQAAVALHNAQLFTAEREQRTLAEALRDTAAAVNSTLQLDAVMNNILANIERVVPHDATSIMFVSEEGDTAHVVGSRGYAERKASVRGMHLRITDYRGLQIGMEAQRPIVISDTESDPVWQRNDKTVWVRSHITLPISREGRVVGFLNLDSATPGYFTDRHIPPLQAFVDQVAVAIHNAQLYNDIERYANELEQRVQERTAALEAQRSQLQTILDTMGEALVHNEGNHVAYINTAFRELFGFSLEEIENDPTGAFGYVTAPLNATPKLTTEIRRSMERHTIWRGEVRLQNRAGRQFDAAMTINRVPNVEGENTVAIMRDISQEKALQAQKDRFIASASHELRTPLANLKTRLYLIRRQPERLQEHMQIIERVTDAMAELIQNLLDVSRFERGVIPLYHQEVDLRALITDVVTIQQAEAEGKQIALTADLPDQPVSMTVDPQRISQVITNLVVNAINYTPVGGRVRVELEDSADGDICIRVRDTGIGIEQENLSQVFEPFFRANEEAASGTGLGLTIAREIINLHGGHITVDSEVGNGTVFTITLDPNAVPSSTDNDEAGMMLG